MNLGQNKRMKQQQWNVLVLCIAGVECHRQCFTTPLTQPIYLIFEHVRLSFNLIA